MVHVPSVGVHNKTKLLPDFHNGRLTMESNVKKVEKPKWIQLLETEADDKWKFWDQRFLKPATRYQGRPGSDIFTGSYSGIGRNCYQGTKISESYIDDGNIYSSLDKDSLYRSHSSWVSCESALRRRNTIVVTMMTIAIMAAVAVCVGVALYFAYPRAILRAHINLKIDNWKYTANMSTCNSVDFLEIADPFCQEMDSYFLHSDLKSYYLLCAVKEMSNGSVRLSYNIDFKDNAYTRNPEKIKWIIFDSSGRKTLDDKVYLVIWDFLVYLKSLNVTIETIRMVGDLPIPIRTHLRPARLPNREDENDQDFPDNDPGDEADGNRLALSTAVTNNRSGSLPFTVEASTSLSIAIALREDQIIEVKDDTMTSAGLTHGDAGQLP